MRQIYSEKKGAEQGSYDEPEIQNPTHEQVNNHAYTEVSNARKRKIDGK